MPDRIVESNQKSNQGDCGCGCGKYGTLKKPNRKGVACVARKCKCRSCINKQNPKRGDAKARKGRKILGLGGANTRHEEHWGGPSRSEFKSGKSTGANTVALHYEKCRAQSEAARPMGDTRPFVAGFCPDDSGHVYFVVRDDDLEQFVFGHAEAWGFGGDAA